MRRIKFTLTLGILRLDMEKSELTALIDEVADRFARDDYGEIDDSVMEVNEETKQDGFGKMYGIYPVEIELPPGNYGNAIWVECRYDTDLSNAVISLPSEV